MILGGYINLFVGFIAITLALYIPFCFYIKQKGVGLLRQASYLLLFYSFFLVVFATLILFQLPFTFTPHQHIVNLQPLKWIWEDNIRIRVTSEIWPNIAVFIPMGFFLPMVFTRMRKWYASALAVLGITFSIETFQYFIGRSSDVDDLIANLLGGIIGYCGFKCLCYLLRDHKMWRDMVGV